MSEGTWIGIALLAFAVGCRIGAWSEASKWRGNAEHVWRVASGGRLYKVHYDE